jgi:predicted dehydrogenase
VEWPLDRNLSVAQEMSTLAHTHNAKTMVGIQGSFSPVIRSVKEIVEGGRIGKVLSSSVFASTGNAGPTEVKNVRYFLDREVGGNILSIHFGHSLEFITSGMYSACTPISLLS